MTLNGPPTRTGRLYGVGLGPGDPSLLTVRAVEVIGAVDVVAFHSARHGRSIARSIASRYFRDGTVEEALVYPLTTGSTTHPGGYRGALEDFYAEASGRLAAHLDAGRDVAVLSEGDPFVYSSYQHLHKRLAHRYDTEVVPGVSSLSATGASLGRPLVEADEVLTVIPGTLPEEELTARIAAADSAVILKLGRTFPAVRRALERAGRLGDAAYVERATMAGERTAPLSEVDPESVPYFSMAVLPSKVGDPRADHQTPTSTCPGSVSVVGLGPAGAGWLTPEARGALAAADDLVGYTTYVDRVPARTGQRRHDSDNKVESERAEFALDLARQGRRVAVVSSGDPGVFAMASAVLEVASEERYSGVPVRVVRGRPGRARRSDTTTPPSRSPTGSSRGRSSPSGWRRRPRPTWSSCSTTRRPGAGPGRSAVPGTSCWSIAPRTRPWSWRVTSAAPRSRSGSCTSPTSTPPSSTCAPCSSSAPRRPGR